MEKTVSIDQRPVGSLGDYISIARPDHWIKHIFILPGIVLAYVLINDQQTSLSVWPIALGFISACAIASANYVINEWLDAEFDKFHPIKSKRPAVNKGLKVEWVYTEYALLSVIGLVTAWLVGFTFFVTSVAFLVSGWIYNIKPIRSKDHAYIDVATEALNNPIRLTLGWAMVDASTLPPASLLVAYWMGGAFLMAIKRFAEYRHVSAREGTDILHLYRASFKQYTENSLLIYSFVCALMASFFLAIFLIKYRVEYLVTLPLFALLFGAYLRLGLGDASNAQTPEKLFKERLLMIVVGLLVAAVLVTTFVDFPSLEFLASPHYIRIGG